MAAAMLAGTEEDPAIDLNALVAPFLGLAVVVLAVIVVFTLIGLVVQNRRVTALEVRLLRLTRGNDGGSLEDVLESHLDTVGRMVDDVDELAARTAVLDARSQRAFSRIGLVRFNPFEDTGGNQSFALALLDGREDGIILSSLHSRAATRIYAKAVAAGRSDGALSAEESQAVELARSSSGGRSMDGALDVRIATAGGSTVPATIGGAAATASGSGGSTVPQPAGPSTASDAGAGTGGRGSETAGGGAVQRAAPGTGSPPGFATASSAYPSPAAAPRTLPDGGDGGR